MTTDEFDSALSDLETRVDRLRALYENWFRGYEKSEPSVARKEVERRVYALRKELPRNTALRFRYHQLYLRYTSLSTYWQRTARQIEDGTHKLQLQRLRRRNQRGGERDAGEEQRDKRDEGGPRHYELDLDESLNVDDLLDDLEMEEVARALDAPGPHSEPPPPPRPAPVARSFARQKREDSLPSLPPVALDDADFPAARAGAQARRTPRAGASEFPDFPDFAEPPTAVRDQPAVFLPGLNTKREPLPAAREARLPLPPQATGAAAARGGAQPASPGARQAPARVDTQPLPGRAPTGHAAGQVPLAAGAAGVQRGGPAASPPRPTAGAGAPLAAAPGAQAGGRPAPGSPVATAAGWGAPGTSTGTGAGRPAPAATSTTGADKPAPMAPSSTAAGRPALATPSTTAAGRPAPAAASATAAGRQAPATASATAAGRQAPAAANATAARAPVAPAASRPGAPGQRPVPIGAGDTIVGRPPLSSPLTPAASSAPDEQRLRRIYDEYAAARRRNNEGDIRYEAMVNSIQKMLPELAKKHQGRPIDFEVVVKDGRVGLKPKAT